MFYTYLNNYPFVGVVSVFQKRALNQRIRNLRKKKARKKRKRRKMNTLTLMSL